MENASKALIIAGAILLSILIIAIGMYIYTSSQATIQNSMTDMNTQEIEAFNANFSSYQGTQTGSQVKALFQRLQANAKTYQEQPDKVPTVTVTKLKSSDTEAKNYKVWLSVADAAGAAKGGLDLYVKGLSTLSNGVELKHKYTVNITVGASGLVEFITVNYGSNGNDDSVSAFGTEVTDAPGDANMTEAVALK